MNHFYELVLRLRNNKRHQVLKRKFGSQEKFPAWKMNEKDYFKLRDDLLRVYFVYTLYNDPIKPAETNCCT